MTTSARSGDHPYPIRPVSPDEFDTFNTVDLHAFHGSPLTPDDRELVVARLEFDRTLAAFDGTRPYWRPASPGSRCFPRTGAGAC
jgi:hypothetical protein